MTPPVREPSLTNIVQSAFREVRDHFLAAETPADREIAVNRFLGVIAASVAVALSIRRRNEGMAAALFAVAVKLWTRLPGPSGNVGSGGSHGAALGRSSWT